MLRLLPPTNSSSCQVPQICPATTGLYLQATRVQLAREVVEDLSIGVSTIFVVEHSTPADPLFTYSVRMAGHCRLRPLLASTEEDVVGVYDQLPTCDAL